jgi:hypothetical protein
MLTMLTMLTNWLHLCVNVSFQFALLDSFVWLITRFRPFQSAPIGWEAARIGVAA